MRVYEEQMEYQNHHLGEMSPTGKYMAIES